MVRDLWFWLPLLVAFIGMEFWSRWIHRALWHGPLWGSHASHHAPRSGWWERNDLFAVMHALIAAPMVYAGLRWQLAPLAGWGFGMTAFGAAYFTVHDGFIHGRLPVAFLARSAFLRQVRNAHRAHHHRDHAAPFGLFLGPQELRAHQRALRASRDAASALGA